MKGLSYIEFFSDGDPSTEDQFSLTNTMLKYVEGDIDLTSKYDYMI